MKILVICQYYAPEPFRISNVCEALAERGHEIHVVTGYPNYPEGKIYPGYGRGKHIDETVKGVSIHRCFTIPRKTGMLFRLLNYYSYSISSKNFVRSRTCKALDGNDFDVVFCYQLSPVMMAEAAVTYQKRKHVPVVLYCLDLWPESLIAGGIQRSSLVYKFFHKTSGRIYRTMDRILVSSRMFESYMETEFSIDPDRVQYLPQFAEGVFHAVPQKRTGNQCELVFAGNIGEVQSVDTILKAANILRNEPILFHIVGGGTDLERLKSMKLDMDLENVFFHGRKPIEQMPDIYGRADAMLVTLKADPVLSMTLPGKVQSYLAAGKPIIGAIDGETCNVIREADCGFCGPAEDSVKLAENIRRFMACQDKKRLAENAKSYYETRFAMNRFISELEETLFRIGS